MDESNDADPSNGRVIGLVSAALDNAALEDLLQRVVVLACHSIAKADAASITVADRDGFRTTNAIGDEALPLDEKQYEQGAGPCLEAIRSGRQLQLVVGSDGGRWSAFEERAVQLGVTTVLSTPLGQGSDGAAALAALNLYSRKGGGFEENEQQTARIIGDHAGMLVANTLALLGATHLNEQLRQALASREVIGEAKGIIMERQSCTRDEAFDILRRASQRENRKLRDLAEELVARVEARKGPGRPAQ